MKKDNDISKIKAIENVGKRTLDDYKKFAVKGNVVDLAVGVVIGAAFTNIINTLVTTTITPILGVFTNKVDLSSLFVSLTGGSYENLQAAKNAGALVINYGALLNSIINFILVSFILFIIVKNVSKLKAKLEHAEQAEKQVTEKDCPYCLSKIPLEAKKCAFCTSDLKVETKVNE